MLYKRNYFIGARGNGRADGAYVPGVRPDVTLPIRQMTGHFQAGNVGISSDSIDIL